VGQILALIFLSAISLGVVGEPEHFSGESAGLDRTDRSGSIPTRDTPPELAEVWLRFHRADLCQGVDALFVFHKDGVEVRYRIEDAKSYRKFLEMVEPLRQVYRIELLMTGARKESGPSNRENPPPSLWENDELRASLDDPFAVSLPPMRLGRHSVSPLFRTERNSVLKERLIMFAEQTLDWNRKMRRYAEELQALALVASDPAAAPKTKSLAATVCISHAENVEKYAKKLNENLVRAMPKGKPGRDDRREKSIQPGIPPVDLAAQLAVSARIVSGRVYSFIYPANYTVGLDDLRQPSLLASLKTLQRMASNFRKSIKQSRR